MTDIVDQATRSRMMSGIRGKNTKPELAVRKGLFAKGLRYRLHDKRLPGKPDLVFPKYHTVLFVHGCFWHGHDCKYFKWPQSNIEFWRNKISGNQARFSRQKMLLEEQGWRVLVVHECEISRLTPAASSATVRRLYRQITARKTRLPAS